jgi:hypothetical protein
MLHKYHGTEAAKKKRTAYLAERKRVDDFMAARGRGGALSGARSTAAPTAAQIHSKGAETLRKKHTPSGLQGLVDVLTRKKKKR